MLEERDLQAIAALIDGKLSGIQSDISEMKGNIAGLKEDVAGLKEDVAGLKEDVAGLKEDVAAIKETLEEHTVALNELIEWTEQAAIEIRIPFAEPKQNT